MSNCRHFHMLSIIKFDPYGGGGAGGGDARFSILPEIRQHVFLQGSIGQHYGSKVMVVGELDHEEDDVPEQVEAVDDDGDDAECDAASHYLRNEDKVTIFELTEQQQQVLSNAIFVGNF